jgi:putative phosphoesterase
LRIGVISDTHNHLGNVARIVELLNRAGVDRVVHTGDITQPKTLEALACLAAPLYGVFGNNDLERPELESSAARLGMRFADPPLALDWAGRRVVVVHDPLDLARLPDGAPDVALHGHTHRLTIERPSGRLVFNPGECAGHMVGRNAVGVVSLDNLETEILLF